MKLSKPFVRLPFAFDTVQLAKELKQFQDSSWMSHPSRMEGNSAIALVSLNGEDNDEFSGKMMPTPHLQRCEYIQQIMANLGEVFARSRLMRLAGGSQVSPHVDFNYHWYNRVRIHIPIVTNPDVIFYCGDEKVHMQAGECWLFDSWREHNVVNSNPHDRTHLVLDTAGSSRFWAMVREAQNKDYGSVKLAPLAYIPGLAPPIKTERFNVSPVMSPGELEALTQDLIDDFSGHGDNDPNIIVEYQNLLVALAKDWREIWSQYGYRSTGFPHYQALLQQTRNRMHQNPRALVTASNNIGVNPIIVQRILRAALFTDQRAEFLAD
jgi:hypothetical protein